MEQDVVKYEGDGYAVEITVQKATLRQGIGRATLMSEQLTILKETPEVGFLGKMVATATYPACLAVTMEIINTGAKKLDIKKLPLEEFLDLPDEMINRWEAMVYELNPAWDPFPTPPKAEGDQEEGEVLEPDSETSSQDV